MSDLKQCHETSTGAIVTPKGRMTFCAVAEKYKDRNNPDDKGQYAVCLVIPPDADITPLKNAVAAAAKEKFGDKAKGLRNPIRDAGENDRPGHNDGWYMIRANTFQQAPGVVDGSGKPVNKLEPGESVDDVKERTLAEVYSGRWARISVMAKAYDNNGNKGVKFYLNNVQVLDHDEPLGGRRARPEEDFAPVDAGGGAAEGGASAGGTSDSIFD